MYTSTQALGSNKLTTDDGVGRTMEEIIRHGEEEEEGGNGYMREFMMVCMDMSI